MSAMKKTTISTTKSPAPAKKSTKPAAARKAAPVAPPALEPATATTATAIATAPAVTTIVAQIDVGFGNALYLRGSSAGLSWDRGLLMESIASDQWRAVLGESSQPVVFKLLVNDETWCVGEDYTVTAGGSVTVAPVF